MYMLKKKFNCYLHSIFCLSWYVAVICHATRYRYEVLPVHEGQVQVQVPEKLYPGTGTGTGTWSQPWCYHGGIFANNYKILMSCKNHDWTIKMSCIYFWNLQNVKTMPLLLKNGVEIYIYFISNPSVCAFQEVYTLPIWTSKAIFSKWRNFGLHISYSLTSYNFDS